MENLRRQLAIFEMVLFNRQDQKSSIWPVGSRAKSEIQSEILPTFRLLPPSYYRTPFVTYSNRLRNPFFVRVPVLFFDSDKCSMG